MPARTIATCSRAAAPSTSCRRGPQALPGRQEPVAGDVRLVVALVEGKPAATLYRAVAANAPEAERVLFESPIGKVAFDQVESIGDRIQLAVMKSHIECAIPLKVIGLKPAVGLEVLADVGLLRGREGAQCNGAIGGTSPRFSSATCRVRHGFTPRWGSWVFR